MQSIACSVLLFVILGESYSTTTNITTTVNQTNTSWGYDFSHTDTSGFKVKHDRENGYQFEPMYNNTSSGLKKHYNFSSVYDQFTSPGTNTSIPQSNLTSNVINGTSNGNTDSRANSTVLHKVLLNTPADREQTTEFRTLPILKNHTVTVTETQTDAPTEPNAKAKAPLSPSQGTVFGTINWSPNVPLSRPLYEATYAAPYGSQISPMYRAPTSPMYPQVPTSDQIYGPVGGSIYGIPNRQMNMPPPGPFYGSTYGQPAGPMNGYAPYGYGPQNGPIYGPQYGQMYGPQHGQMYGPQHGQMYGPQNGQMYGPGNDQTYGYPTGPLYGPYRNY